MSAARKVPGDAHAPLVPVGDPDYEAKQEARQKAWDETAPPGKPLPRDVVELILSEQAE